MNTNQNFLVLSAMQNYLKSKVKKRRKIQQNLLLVIHCRNRYIQNAVGSLLSTDPFERDYWMMVYKQSWFENIWMLRHTEVIKMILKKEFRMNPHRLELIINLVSEVMTRQHTNFREPILVQKRVAIAVWRLATGNAYRAVSKVFGVSEGSVGNIVLEFCSVLKFYAHRFIRFPVTVAETENAIASFKETIECEIPQVVGCLDCMHTSIFCPDSDSKVDYYNRKQTYSVNTQAIVGSNLKFLDISTGFPGSMHDARVLRRTNLFARAQNEEILVLPTANISGEEVKPLLLADGAYPPLRWLLKPYPHHHNLTREERNFNKRLSASRSSVERAFGLLKVRWRCLLKPLEHLLENIPDVIIACCVLHNICQDNGEEIHRNDRDLLRIIVNNEGRVANQEQICDDFDGQRNLIAEYLVMLE